MDYCLCLKKSDNNLLHIVSAKELERPFYSDYRTVAVAGDEEAAFQRAADLVGDFCKLFWDKGENPDFTRFKAWVWRARVNYEK